MTDDLVKQSIAELQDIVRCRCHPAYKDRGMHDPDCECDSADAVKTVIDYIAELEEYKAMYEGLFKAAADRIKELEAENKLLSEGATIAHLRGAMDAHANRADDIWAEFKDKWEGDREVLEGRQR